MTTQEFLDRLSPHAAQPLHWHVGDQVVPGGYHVTEIKAARLRTMDCGGTLNEWNETLLQVLPPLTDAGEAPMTVAKFRSIWNRVTEVVPVEDDALVRVEYGEPGAPAVAYLVDRIEASDAGVAVRLLAPVTACKANEPAAGDVPALRPVGSEDALPVSAAACC